MKKICSSLSIFFCLLFVSPSLFARDAEEEYAKAKSCYGELKVTPSKAKNRGSWERCIDLFEEVHKKYPKLERGPQALYTAAKIKAELYGKFKKTSDVEDAIKLYNQLIREYPTNSLADDALYQIGRLRRDPLKQNDRAKTAFEYLIENYPGGDMVERAKEDLKTLESGGASDLESKEGAKTAKDLKAQNFDENVAGPRSIAVLGSIDVEKKDAETAVFLNLTRRATYSLDFTDTGLRTKSPPVLDMLLSYTKAATTLKNEISVSSPHLASINVKKSYLGGGVRLIFKMTPGSTYEISSKGEKIVLRFKRLGERPNTKSKSVNKLKENETMADKSDKIVVVIDPGHGGEDSGAIGPSGLEEKDVTLAVAKALAGKLKEKPGVKVILTRSGDATLTLEDRNAVAVVKRADLFVSVHANAAKNRKMRGIETYYLNNATDEAAAKLARRENKAAKKKLSDVEHILSTMLQNLDAAESRVLASDVQSSLMNRMGKKYKDIKNRRVRSALFYVLVGAKCPAILVETSFISNPKEEARLKEAKYINDLASSITDGVQKYIRAGDKRIGSL